MTSNIALDSEVSSQPKERRLLVVLVLGLASAAVYLTAFTLTWPLWRLFAQPQADYAWFGLYTPSSQTVYLGAFALLFGLQYGAYRVVRGMRLPGSIDLIVAGQVLFGILNVWIYPVAALDLYDYLMYGRIVLVYGGNPFISSPSAYPDPLIAYSPWPNERSVYGPVWQILSLIPTALSGGDMLRGLLAFKVLGLLTFLACTLVIWHLLGRIAPAYAAAGTLLFAWNPLLQFELVGNGHNDVLMVLFVLLAIWALIAQRHLLVLPLLALAVLTKLPAVALGPIFLYGLLRGPSSRRDKLVAIVGGGIAALALTVALYAPFWEGFDTLYFLSRGNWFTASIPTMLREILRQWYPYEEAGRLASTIVGLSFVGFTAWRLWMLWQDEGPEQTADGDWLPWLSAAHDLTFFYLAFATLWWQPWYLTWLVALAALLPSRLLHERALLFCYGGVLNYLVFKYIWPVFQPMTYTTIMGMSVILIFGMPLLHLAATAGIPVRQRPDPTPSAVTLE
jgi:alpha-1,6-mannosyltransferase